MSAFCHSISASLSYVRSNVSRCCRTLGKDSPTSLLHLELLPYGDILEAIASLCGRVSHFVDCLPILFIYFLGLQYTNGRFYRFRIYTH